jgi:hypothetical protein
LQGFRKIEIKEVNDKCISLPALMDSYFEKWEVA